MLQIPFYIPLLFIATTLVTLFFFYKATHQDKKVLLLIAGWALLQSVPALSGFYTHTSGFPPRLFLLIVPPLLATAILFVLPAGRKWLSGLQLKWLTLLHIVRIPVEIMLLLLYLQHAIPGLMTFEGRNPDILSGITAPLIFLLVFKKEKFRANLLLVWNVLCLLLLLNIVIHAVLAAPTPFQKLAFDQPNTAILYFPFVWLPAVVVPLVLLSHLVSIFLLLKRQRR